MEQQEQTAVEWFVDELKNMKIGNNQLLINYENLDYLIEKAKEMEKQQIIDAWNNCLCIQDFNDKCAEYYYNETYGKTHQPFQAPRS